VSEEDRQPGASRRDREEQLGSPGGRRRLGPRRRRNTGGFGAQAPDRAEERDVPFRLRRVNRFERLAGLFGERRVALRLA